MTILLLNIPVRFNAFENSQPPLGIAYLAAVCRQQGLGEIILRDYEVEPFSDEDFLRILREKSPEVVAFSCRTASYPAAVELARKVARSSPRSLIVFGGHHPTALPGEVLSESPAQVVVRREGEETFPDLIRTLEEGGALARVPGISFRDAKGEIRHNPDRDFIADLDSLPMPAWDLLPMKRYAYGVVLSSRGCPFQCIYCDKNISTREVRYRSEESVVDELDELVNVWKRDLIYFDDDHFMLNKDRFFRILDLAAARGLAFQWKCQARVDSIDLEVLEKAKSSGCTEIIFGVETGDEKELCFIRKAGNATLDQTRRVFRWARRVGIATRANFMLGFPVSTPETVSNTIRFAAELDADNYRFFHVVPLPNTELWEYCLERQLISAETAWEKFTFSQAVLEPETLSLKQLQRYSGAAYLHVFRRKVAREVTLEFIPRLVRFASCYRRIGRVSSSLFRTFPAFANMAAEIWFLMANRGWRKKARFLYEIWSLERKLS